MVKTFSQYPGCYLIKVNNQFVISSIITRRSMDWNNWLRVKKEKWVTSSSVSRSASYRSADLVFRVMSLGDKRDEDNRLTYHQHHQIVQLTPYQVHVVVLMMLLVFHNQQLMKKLHQKKIKMKKWTKKFDFFHLKIFLTKNFDFRVAEVLQRKMRWMKQF